MSCAKLFYCLKFDIDLTLFILSHKARVSEVYKMLEALRKLKLVNSTVILPKSMVKLVFATCLEKSDASETYN